MKIKVGGTYLIAMSLRDEDHIYGDPSPIAEIKEVRVKDIVAAPLGPAQVLVEINDNGHYLLRHRQGFWKRLRNESSHYTKAIPLTEFHVCEKFDEAEVEGS